jgi:transposase
MRWGFYTLAQIVQQAMQADPLSGDLFLFTARRRDRLKILYWDRDGLALWYKRLEQGAFRIPKPAHSSAAVELTASELAMLLEGIDLGSIRRSPRYAKPAAAVNLTGPTAGVAGGT